MRASWSAAAVLVSGLSAQAQQPYLVSDINPIEDHTVGFEFDAVVATSQAVYFQDFRSLHRVVPSSPTPQLVWSFGSSPFGIVAVGDVLYFADENLEGSGLYRSDGTSQGTGLVPGSPADPLSLTDVAGTLFFIAHTGPLSAAELWKSDGSGPGTVRVSPAGGEHLTTTSNRLFYVRNEPATGEELWTSDGSAAGTHLVADICPGQCSGVHLGEERVAVGGVLYFVGDDGIHGSEIWRSDGTAAGTRMVRDASPEDTPSFPSHLTAWGNLLLYGYRSSESDPAVWRSDGSAAGTFALRTGLEVTSIHPASAAAFFVAADDATGEELWRTDGTAAGTTRLTDICPGSCDSLDYSTTYATVPGGVVFTRQEGFTTQLWRSDGSALGTAPYATFDQATFRLHFGGGAYFVANHPLYGEELWRTDGTAVGTVLATDRADSSSFRNMVGSVGNRLFVQAFRPDVGQELWTTTGTAASTMALELDPGPGSSGAVGGAALGDALLFHGFRQNQSGLWRTDGTPAGTREVAPVTFTSNIAVRDGLAFFGGGAGGDGELWRSDGTTAGTFRLKDVNPGPPPSLPQHFTVLPDRVLFVANPGGGAFPQALWRTDGTSDGTSRLLPGPCSPPVRVGSTAYVACGSPADLWITDGTPSGTRPVAPTTSFFNATDVEGRLFFSGEVLWTSDGTSAGTHVVQTSSPVAAVPISLTASAGVLFFIGVTKENGAELWRSDGTDAGTHIVRDILPGPASGLTWTSGQIAAVAGGVVFSAYRADQGQELWFSDGTDAGTVSLGDVEPGAGGTSPGNLTSVGARVYFSASQTPTDWELWAVDFPAATAVGDARAYESDAGTVLDFAIGLTAPATGTVTIAYTTAAGTAQAGTDFLPASGTLTFAPGTTGPQVVQVAVIGDLQDEPSETFTLRLTSVTGALTADARAEGEIVDDDGPTVSLAGAAVAEGDAGTTAVPVVATLTTKDGTPLPVDKTLAFETAGGTAGSGSDFEALAGTLTFGAGTPSGSIATVPVLVRGDTADEPDESFTVLFSANGDETVLGRTVGMRIEDDDGIEAAAPVEVAPGSILRADLAPPAGRATDRDYYVMLQQPQSSYEIVVDEASGETVPLTLQRIANDGSTVLQSAATTGTGSALGLRWQNTSSAAIPDQHLAVSSPTCGSACGADDRYRLRVYETTLSAPRFNNVNRQGTVVLLQNRSDEPISGRLLFWMPAGWLGHEQPFSVAARGTVAINTLAILGASGSLTVTHDGPYGALAGKAVALEPATGFSFDTPLTPRPR
jgi:ELWxxDGT repeat protein